MCNSRNIWLASILLKASSRSHSVLAAGIGDCKTYHCSKNNLSSGGIIGLVLGVVALVAIIVGASIWYYHRRQSPQSTTEKANGTHSSKMKELEEGLHHRRRGAGLQNQKILGSMKTKDNSGVSKDGGSAGGNTDPKIEALEESLHHRNRDATVAALQNKKTMSSMKMKDNPDADNEGRVGDDAAGADTRSNGKKAGTGSGVHTTKEKEATGSSSSTLPTT